MSSDAPLIVMDARLTPGEAGGVETAIQGMAHGLSAQSGPERYLFLTYEEEQEWLRPFISGACEIVPWGPKPSGAQVGWWVWLRTHVPPIGAAWDRYKRSRGRGRFTVPPSDGRLEAMGVDVVHFIKQDTGFVTSIPSIYNPHDLQHCHYPEFFSAEALEQRNVVYPTMCHQAAIVAVSSEWTRRDVHEQYDVPLEKIAIIPFAPAIEAYAPIPEQRRRELLDGLGVPQPFLYYPAQTWAHKNHARLIQAIASLRDEGVRVNLVCSGKRNEFYDAELAPLVERLRLASQVCFTGFVGLDELRALYEGALGIVIPSLFEAFGGAGVLFEAFALGKAVACSNVTSLPEQVGGAGLLFDPEDTAAIADSLRRLWTDEGLRRTLGERGLERSKRFTWDHAARMYRAYYRMLAGASLTGEDQALLDEQPAF